MSYDSHAADASAPPSATERFPAVIATTVVLLFATILLGVATKAAGAGLACNANWPLCDGGLLNLFPATVPSFFEWIHRVVAMVAGFAVLGTALLAWLGATSDDRVRYAVTAGLALLPIQVMLGRETVLQYELTILSLHYWTAIAIFALFVVAAVLVWADRLPTAGAIYALWFGAGLVPLQVALSPLFVSSYSQPVQTAQYAVTLSLITCVALAAVLVRRRFADRLASRLVAVAPGLAVLVMAFGRPVGEITYASVTDVLYLGTATLLFLTLAAAAAVAGRR